MTIANNTFFPTNDEAIAPVVDFVDAFQRKHSREPDAQCFLSGPGKNEHVALPRDLHEILAQAARALMSGQAVTIHPNNTTITTQEAADLLGVSRPTVVRLIDAGKLPAEKINRHRRLLLGDVLEYHRELQEKQRRFIADTTDDGPAPSAEDFRTVRRKLARARENRSLD